PGHVSARGAAALRDPRRALGPARGQRGSDAAVAPRLDARDAPRHDLAACHGRPSFVPLTVILTPPGALLGQSRVSQLVDSARVQLTANHLDSAEAPLRGLSAGGTASTFQGTSTSRRDACRAPRW